MTLYKIAWRSIQQRSMSSILTGLSMALGVTLMVAILTGGETVQKSYKTGPRLNHALLVGPKDSAAHLVLYSVFHTDQRLNATLPWSYYKEFLPANKRADNIKGKYADYVDLAIPVNKGDNFRGYHVVGTNSDFFTTPKSLNPKRPNPPLFEIEPGGKFFDDNEFMTGVLGAVAARELNLKVGDQFNPTHFGEEGHVHDPFTVVGILKPTGTPNDRALFINIEGHLLQEGHAKLPANPEHAQQIQVNDKNTDGNDKPKHESAKGKKESTNSDEEVKPKQSGLAAAQQKLPEDQRAVSVILIRPSGGQFSALRAQSLERMINEDRDATAAMTVRVAQEHFMNAVRPMLLILGAMTTAILITSAISILVGFYNSMNERQREIAIFRALGASRNTVMMIMFVESVLLALLGGFVGWILGHLLVGIGGSLLTPMTGITFSTWDFSIYELILIPALIILAGVVGFIPAMNAYKTDVSKCLTRNN